MNPQFEVSLSGSDEAGPIRAQSAAANQQPALPAWVQSCDPQFKSRLTAPSQQKPPDDGQPHLATLPVLRDAPPDLH